MRFVSPLFLYQLLLFIPLFSVAQVGPHYDIKSSIDIPSHTVHSEVTITVLSESLNDGQLMLMLAKDAEVTQIRSDQLVNTEIKPVNNTFNQYILSFDEDLPEKVQMLLRYSLKIPEDHEVNRITADWIELNIDSFWHPVFSTFPLISYQLRLTLNDAYQLLSGDKVEVLNDSSYLIANRIPRRDIPFSAARRIYKEVGDLSEIYSSNPDLGLDSVLRVAENSLSFLKSYIDQPHDFETRRTVVVSPREDVGYARKNYIVLSDIGEDSAEELAAFLTHEFSHYWFSNGNPGSSDHWLNESFAEYLSLIYLREAYGEALFEEQIQKKRTRAKEDQKTLADYSGRPSYLALYHKGPLVLYEFEKTVGEENFKKLIRRMVDQNTSTNQNLNKLVEQLFGREALGKLKALKSQI